MASTSPRGSWGAVVLTSRKRSSILRPRLHSPVKLAALLAGQLHASFLEVQSRAHSFNLPKYFWNVLIPFMLKLARIHLIICNWTQTNGALTLQNFYCSYWCQYLSQELERSWKAWVWNYPKVLLPRQRPAQLSAYADANKKCLGRVPNLLHYDHHNLPKSSQIDMQFD